jgi:hypothetical protein
MPDFRRNHPLALLVGFLCATTLVVSCSSDRATAPPSVVPTTRDIETDSAHYTLVHLYVYVANIAIRFTNRTAAAVTFVSCDGSNALFHFEKLVDTSWVRPSSPTFGVCTTGPTVVPAGGQLAISFKMSTPFPGTFGVPETILTDIPGTYRVVWDGDLPSLAANGTPAAEFRDSSVPDNRISNTFTLSVSP